MPHIDANICTKKAVPQIGGQMGPPQIGVPQIVYQMRHTRLTPRLVARWGCPRMLPDGVPQIDRNIGTQIGVPRIGAQIRASKICFQMEHPRLSSKWDA